MASEGGQFDLGSLIGEGGFGKVFECFDKKDGKKFALKKIDLGKSSAYDRNLAETEAKLLTSLQNEYILHAVMAFQENETLCIVTEFCDQGDLAQFLEERKGESLDEQRIVEWFRQICSALEYLHGKDVLHRDIKTQNIFLTGNEMTAKLGDFGVAKVLESPTQKVLSFHGSPYYMSPEIYAYKPYNSKTDIWALGVCVYEMVALKLPFDAPQMQQLVYKIIHDELPPLPEGYSPELIEIIERMMCREIYRRPSASELLQNTLFKNHNSSKVEFFLPNKKTTRGKLSTNEDMDKTISDNTLRININAREYDSYLPSKSTVSNSEIITLDTELPEAGGSETSSEDGKSFVSKITADKALSTFQPPSSTSTKIRSFCQSFKRSLMEGATESDGRNSISSRPKRGIQRPYDVNGHERQFNDLNDKDRRKPQNEWVEYNYNVTKLEENKVYNPKNAEEQERDNVHDKDRNIVQKLKEDRGHVHEEEKGASGISEGIWHPPSYTDRQDSEAVLQQEFETYKEGKEDEKDEERRLMDEKVNRIGQSKENNRKPENVGHGKPKSSRPRPGLDSYLSSESTVLNTESFEASTSDTELSKASSSEDSNEKFFERTKIAEKARYTFQLPLSSTFTIMGSLFGYFTRSLMFGVVSLMMHWTTELEEFLRPLPSKEIGRQPNERKNTDKKSLHSDWKENYTAVNVERPKNQKIFWDKDLTNEKHLYEYFWKRHSVFSQWYPCKFTVDEITYRSAEQYMMHQKAVLMDDKESAEIILALHEPAEIKKIGRHVQNFNQELWKSCCLDVVEKGNMAKFSQNEELKEKLFNTYPKTLVEASPIDTIWGIGLSEKDERAWNKDTWRGQNLLGEILTKVRDKLLELEPFPVPVVRVKQRRV